ncbi:MAG: hypothetical protein ACRDTJ_31715 [Pseudonocardiaceae bacterium]
MTWDGTRSPVTLVGATAISTSGGFDTIDHGAETTPTFVSAYVAGNASASYGVLVTAQTTSTFTVAVYLRSTGALVSNGPFTIRWRAEWT